MQNFVTLCIAKIIYLLPLLKKSRRANDACIYLYTKKIIVGKVLTRRTEIYGTPQKTAGTRSEDRNSGSILRGDARSDREISRLYPLDRFTYKALRM